MGSIGSKIDCWERDAVSALELDSLVCRACAVCAGNDEGSLLNPEVLAPVSSIRVKVSTFITDLAACVLGSVELPLNAALTSAETFGLPANLLSVF